ncbi:MAG: energy transducer TonB [Alphaproteobacteria bacterium]|nr:energy transducer TonB [Alphaproteobacteria bacterium]
MIAAVLNEDTVIDVQGTMKTPLATSLIFHAVILAICMMGLPYLKPDIDILPDSVPIEIATVDDMSTTDRAPARADVEKPKPEDVPEDKPKPKPPTNTAEAPQKPVLEKPKPVEKPKPPEPRADDLADPDKKPQEKPKEEPQEKPKPPEKKPVIQQEQNDAFSSLLKNLEETKPVAGAQKIEAPTVGAAPSPMASLSDRLAANEIQARLQKQLGYCWNVLAGAKYAENLIVDIRIFVNQDRTVRDAQVLDQMRYSTDTYFRAAADSALRALRHPYCTPLDLPPEKYDLWKTMVFRFDPSSML